MSQLIKFIEVEIGSLTNFAQVGQGLFNEQRKSFHKWLSIFNCFSWTVVANRKVFL